MCPAISAAALYRFIERTPGALLLESPSLREESGVRKSKPLGSRLFLNPLRVHIVRTLNDLSELFIEIEHATAEGHHAAGYFTYECGEFFEPSVGSPHLDAAKGLSTTKPLAWFGIYERFYWFNHSKGAFDEQPPGFTFADQVELNADEASIESSPAITEAYYADKFAQVQEFIRSGDVYQLNLTWPFHVKSRGSSAALYARLRTRQAAPYGAFLHTEPAHRVLCFSPELFFHLRERDGVRHIVTRPMKGIAARGRTLREDQRLAQWLQNDEKNRAENVMIVDLLRNDLGRVCEFGSVKVSDLFAVERYPNLWQMTSTVRGDVRSGVTFEDIFRALFPCGSVTGAPKVRAMQLLAQLEETPRGIYTGAIGFFSKFESLFNVAIRTLVLEGDETGETGVFGVGSGVVIDSNAKDEFGECLLKARFLCDLRGDSTPPDFSLVETLLWEGKYPFIEQHLDRLEESAEYFAFPFNRAEIRAALMNYADRLAATRYKIRMLLDSDGKVSIAHEELPESSDQLLRVRIADERTDPNDCMLFHKTTHRPVYLNAVQAAGVAGFDEVIFLNARGEVTEAANHNLFIERGGELLTPPVDCGLLAGVQRGHILATHSNAKACVLTLDDLRSAEAVFLCNAVRGIRHAIIDWPR